MIVHTFRRHCLKALFICSIALVPGNSSAAKAVSTRTYYKNSLLVNAIRTGKHIDSALPVNIAVVSDWDAVIANQRTNFGSTWQITRIVGLKSVGKAFRANRRNLVKKGALYDKDGIKLVGAGNCIRYFGETIPAFRTNHTNIMEALACAKPIYGNIALFQRLHQGDIPIIVWTNNDKEIFDLKLKNLNKRLLHAGCPEFELQGSFYAGKYQCDGTPENQYSPAGKPELAYYEKALLYTKHTVGDIDNSWIYIFIDDKAENVNAARVYAEKTGLPLIAIQCNNHKKFRRDIAWIFGYF
jgi:hypothetical protein